MAHGGQAERRDPDPCRSALHPHVGGVRSLRGHRSGSDIAFLGGLVNYVLTHDRWFHEYVLAYTNASTIIDEGFQDTEDLSGMFSGFDQQHDSYDSKQGHWGYEESGNGHAEQDGSKHIPEAK